MTKRNRSCGLESMGEVKRFHFDSVCGDTGLIDEEAEIKWWITNVCSVTDLKDNWKSACGKLNELAEENEKLKSAIIGHIQYHEDLEKFAVEKGIIDKDWARFDGYD